MGADAQFLWGATGCPTTTLKGAVISKEGCEPTVPVVLEVPLKPAEPVAVQSGTALGAPGIEPVDGRG